MTPRRNWIAVASADHVAHGRRIGIMQVGHGKGAPLKRLHAGDRIAYYSPVQTLGEKTACQAFTAIGTVKDDHIYQGEMGNGFQPFRRDVDYDPGAHLAPIRPLLGSLSITRDRAAHWGAAFRYGLVQVTDDDMDRIAQAMGATLAHHAPS